MNKYTSHYNYRLKLFEIKFFIFKLCILKLIKVQKRKQKPKTGKKTIEAGTETKYLIFIESKE